MMRRILTICMLVCLLPMVAHAWTLSTWARTAGGTIQVGSGTPQTNLSGAKTATYPTNSPVTVTVLPNTGYVVSQVIYNGTTLLNPTQTAYIVNGPTAQSVQAYYALQKFSITASVLGVGGSVSPTSINNFAYGAVLSAAKKITFIPDSASYAVTSISNIPVGATQSPAVPVAGQPVTVTFPVGFTITSNTALVGAFASENPVAKTGSSQTSFVGATVTLDGSSSRPGGSGISGYSWAKTSGPAATLVNANSAQARFVPTTVGTYIFTLTLMPGGSTASTTVNVFADGNSAVLNDCQNCHAANNSVKTTTAYTKWYASKHQVNSVICINCHVGADTGGHPGTVATNICISCHNATLGASPAIAVGHIGIVDTFTATCYGCHDHSLAASGANLTCSSCHGNPPTTKTLGVSTYTHVSSTCSDCHSVPPTTDATATHRDGTIEILTNANACSVCHSYPPATSSHATAVGGTSPNCATCHIYTGFNAATHNNGTVDYANMSCTSCHGNPPTVLTVAFSGKTGQHPANTNCAMCHGYLPADSSKTGLHRNGTVNINFPAGAPHFNNVTTGAAYPASYVTSKVTSCANCHNSNANNATIRAEWASTGHAATTNVPFASREFKTSSTCVRCHTTTGFIAYSSANMIAAWGSAADKSKEVITCVACHSDVAAGTVRTMVPNKPYSSDLTFTNANVGTSNVCMDCHGGRNTGTAAIAALGNGTVVASNYGTHYLPAGGILQGQVGFNFAGRTYTAFANNAHSNVGMLNSNSTGTNGPCVTCHMSATDKHKFSPVTTDANGAITTITTNVCSSCHAATLPAATLDTKRVAFNNAVEVLRIVLADKGFIWTPATDNFNSGAKTFNTFDQNGKNILGAAHNYKLFIKEAGAYTHNPEYAKQLLADSVEAVVTGGAVTGADISSYLSELVRAGKLNQTQVDNFNGYKNPDSSCNSCHGNPPANVNHTDVSTGTCANCHIYTGPAAATHNNGTIDLKTGTAACTSCHGYPPVAQTILPGFQKYDHTSNTCSDCHITPASLSAITPTHKNNTVDLLTNANACSGCHSYPPASVNHATAVGGTTPNCTNCHIYNGFTAATHNDGTTNFGTMTCSSCHPNLGGSHSAHVGTLLSSVTGYGDGFTGFTGNNSDSTGYKFGCAYCHPTVNASHTNGTIVLNGNGFTGSTKTNITCATASCHSDGKGNFTVTPNWYTGFAGADKCAMCHAAAPVTGSHVAHTSINGIHDGSSGISYDATVTCANCHAGTVDSAKNITYANHVNGVVNVGFAPTSAVSKAQISAASFNAYSTVWTRTGATDTSKLPLSAGNYAGGTCSTIACHNNGTTPTWSTTAKISCVDCHSTL